ncbi:hypothetical protein ABZ656_41045, partial [Streptomyces sp. NPDC007095]|uniref:hypothetical protein n=1 Tax=Streptomyces sp. NPDC007095 TaxID=3154482 RepID=UPI0033D2AAE1
MVEVRRDRSPGLRISTPAGARAKKHDTIRGCTTHTAGRPRGAPSHLGDASDIASCAAAGVEDPASRVAGEIRAVLGVKPSM